MKLSRQFPLNALRVFDAVARLGSFTKAGEELGMTQTAVSYQVKLLEENVGEPLFLRRPRQISLTETGERLAPQVAEAFEMLQLAMAEARGETEVMLQITCLATFASQWLARKLGNFQLANPNIAVRLSTSDTLVDFAREAVDVGIRSGKGDWPGLRADKLMDVHFTPMLSPALAESIGGVHEPADLLKLRIFDLTDPWWHQWLEAAGVSTAGLGTRTTSFYGAQAYEAAAAVAGQGVAILTPDFYPEELATGKLFRPFELQCTDGRGYWLAYPENRRNVPKIKAFRNWILNEMPGGNTQPQNPMSGA
ncbi:LysR substrate-binding domain-containing protein [Rhizobium sp. BK251]|uniref:LysR substrate-binding domain-containing protein n=1 Tax=Rhizobium sp. BK251 TaxID=2512125 RepID=UPI0010437B62|nr:LysR substrate-binding domain-containing protein [Rhizobium sp. BK251]TCL74648.1 LysR family glycine cleavage system transcriptional activator [Rhizobium sp. BK251]